jgi:hypothetical protein
MDLYILEEHNQSEEELVLLCFSFNSFDFNLMEYNKYQHSHSQAFLGEPIAAYHGWVQTQNIWSQLL